MFVKKVFSICVWKIHNKTIYVIPVIQFLPIWCCRYVVMFWYNPDPIDMMYCNVFSVVLWIYILSLIISSTFLAWWWFIPWLGRQKYFYLIFQHFYFPRNKQLRITKYKIQYIYIHIASEVSLSGNEKYSFKTLLEAERN